MKSLPDLSQMSNVVVTSPPPVSAPPANTAGNLGPANAPAVSAESGATTKPEAAEKGSEKSSEHKSGGVKSTDDDDKKRKPKSKKPTLGISGTPEGLTKTPDRSKVDQEIDTERGQQLLGSVKSLVLVREGADKGAGKGKGDALGAIALRVAAQSRTVMEKAGVRVSIGSPAVRATVLKLAIQGKKSPAGTRGTQEITLTGELVCFDPAANDDDAQFAVVWKQEESVGTIAPNASRSGKVPEKMDRKISDFVNRLRVDWQKAVKAFPPDDAEADPEDGIVDGDQGENMFESSAEDGGETDSPEMAGDEETGDPAGEPNEDPLEPESDDGNSSSRKKPD